jgi:hypothetical protein
MTAFAKVLLLGGGLSVAAGFVVAVMPGVGQFSLVLLLLGGVLEAAGVGLYCTSTVPESSAADVPEGEQLYSDRLVTVSNSHICFHHFHLCGATKCVELAALDLIVAKKPTFCNGRWRLWGTGNLRTWFPRDMKRPSRDTIFVTVPRHGGLRIGFTVEDSARFRQCVRKLGLLQEHEAAGTSDS